MLALVREVSPQLPRCELGHLERAPIDPVRAARQHREYTQALQTLGCSLEWLPPLPQHPDGVFVEDTAVVLPELAVITRPGAPSRRGETPSVARALERHRQVLSVTEPGCLDGGDVLHIGRTLFVGASARTNPAGIEQLSALLAPHGYRVRAVPLGGCLHLKSACSFIAPAALLVNASWVDPATFGELQTIPVDEDEPYAANTLTVGGTTLVSAAYPRTRRRLEAARISTQSVEVGELHKAEGGLTCMSLLIEG
ncbi:MAG TPA: N(G),N(G)-dimethylarginine dimethylaminohydrolase [Steroidobacteraceae bacterium]|nr:N(G),N(G)-dimethylarginine dimethylaminohydrolase [Steroidobacteraceae bacterium]